MQLMTADPNRVENPPENGIRTTWLGHASVLFQLDNVNILVNPNFNARGIKYYHPGMVYYLFGNIKNIREITKQISYTHLDVVSDEKSNESPPPPRVASDLVRLCP